MTKKSVYSIPRRAVPFLMAVVMAVPLALFSPTALAGEVTPNKTTTKFVMWDWDTDLQKLGQTVDANSSDTANHYQRILFYQNTSEGRYYFNVDGTTSSGYSRFDEDKIYYPSSARIENSANKEWNQDLIDFDHFVTMTGVNTPYITWAEQAHDGWHAWRIYSAAANDSRSDYALCQVDNYENLDLRMTYDNGTTIRYGAKNNTYRCDPWIIQGHDNDQRFYHWDNDTGGYDEDLYFVHNGKYLKSSNYQKDYFKTYLGREVAVPTLAADFSIFDDQITTLGRPIFYLPRGRTITVKSGGVLSVNGAILNDGQIVVEDGGLLILKSGARIVPFTKYGTATAALEGFVTSRGTVVVERNAILCGGGETGIWISGGNLTNFGLVCGECLTLRARGTVDNRAGGYIIGGRSPSRAMRIQMFRDAWNGVETAVEDVVSSLTKVGDFDSLTTIAEGAIYGNTDAAYVKSYGEKATMVGSADNPLIKVYTKDKPSDAYQELFGANMDNIDLRVDDDSVTYTVAGKGSYTIKNKLVSATLGRSGNGAELLFTDLWAGAIEGGWIQWEPQCAPGMRLDCSDSKEPNNANIHLWTAHGGNNQLWQLVKAGKTGSGATTYYFNTGAYSGSPARGLDLPGINSAQSGNNVALYNNDGGNDQMWTLISTGDKGYYYIRNAQNSGLSLDVLNGGKSNGTNVQVWLNNTGSTAQKWRAANLLTAEVYGAATEAAAALEFSPLSADKTRLDLAGGSSANGTNVQIYTAAQNANQRWTLQLVGTDSLSGVVTPFYRIANTGTGTVLDVAGGAFQNGANVVANAASGANTQYWYLQQTGGGYYIACRGNTDFVLDVAGGGTGNGTNVQIYAKADVQNQKWSIGGVDNVRAAAEEAIQKTMSDPLGNRLFLIKPSDANTRFAFGLASNSTKIGDIDAESYGLWRFMNAGSDTADGVPRPYYQLVSMYDGAYAAQTGWTTLNGKNTDIVRGGSADITQKSQQWYVEKNEDGTYTITSREEGGLVWGRLADRGSNDYVSLVQPGSDSALTWNLVDVTEDPFHGQTVGLEPRNAPGLYLANAEDSYSVNINVNVRTAAVSSFMQWSLIRLGTDTLTDEDGSQTARDYYRLRSGANSFGVAIDGKIQSGANVITTEYRGEKSHEWYLEAGGDGYYSIVSRADPTLALEVAGGGKTDGTNVRVAAKNGSDNQLWKLTGLTSIVVDGKTVDPFDGRIFTLAPGHAADKRLQAYADGGSTRLQIYEERAYDGQKWKFKLAGTETKNGKQISYYYIFSMLDSKVALDTTGATTNGTRPWFYSFSESNNNQKWYVENAGGGYYYIIPRTDQTKVLDCSGDDTGKSNGTVVQLWDRQSTAKDQMWRIIETTETKELGTYFLQPAHAPNMDLCPYSSDNNNGTKLVIWSTRATDYRQWQFIQMGADSIDGRQVPFYRIENKGSGKVIDVPDSDSGAQLQQWSYDYGSDQLWYLEDAGEGYAVIVNRAKSDYCLTAKDSGKVDNTGIFLGKKSGGDNQRWRLVSAMDPVEYGTFEIAPAAAPDLRADLTGGSHDNGANIQLWHRNGAKAQQWTLTQLGTDLIDGEEKAYYSVKSVESGKYWDVPTYNGTITGYNVQQYDNDGYSDMHYYLEDQGDGSFVLRNRRDPSYVVEAEGTEDEKNIKIGTESSGSNMQKWILHKYTTEADATWEYSKFLTSWVNKGRFVLTPQHKTDFVLGVKGNSNDNNVAIVQTDNDGSNYQIWKITQVGLDYVDGDLIPYYYLQNAGSSKVSETNDYRIPTLNLPVRQWAYDGGYDQFYYLEESNTEGVYYFTCRGDRTLCLGIRNNAKAKDTQVMILKKTGGANQQWKLEFSE